MAFKEYENDIYTKEEDDRVKHYIKSIIQRYFQIENDISQETKEAIIIQAYTRLKEILNAYTNKYIICINERSGAVDLSIQDFNGEKQFDKNNAFNKDFCTDTTENKTLWNGTVEIYSHYGNNEADKIVMGDDDRLSDARIPTEHIHTIDDIIGLRDILEQYNLINGGFHVHNNYNVLQMIQYTGSRISIDLRLIEDLVSKVEKTVERLTETDEYFINIAKHYINQLQEIFEPVYKRIEYIKTQIDTWIDWLKEAKIYTDIQNIAYKNNIKKFITNYLSNEEYDILKKALESAITMVDEGVFDVGVNNFKLVKMDSTITKTNTEYFHLTPYQVQEGYTNIQLFDKTSKAITSEKVLSHFHDNLINNGMYKLFLEYTIDGVSYCDKLPHVYQVNNSKHDTIVVYGNTDSENNINLYAKRISEIPVYIQNQVCFNALVKDKSDKYSENSYLILDPTITTDVSNNIIQESNIQKTVDSNVTSFNGETIQFSAEEYKENASDTYNTKCKLSWVLTDPLKYSYKIYKQIDNGPWEDLMKSTAITVGDTQVLQRIFNESDILLFHTSNKNNGVIAQNKTDYWDIINGNVTSTTNADEFQCLLTGEDYTVYRHTATLTSTGDYDNDGVAIILSAIQQNGVWHTLSLFCDKAGEGHVTGSKGTHIIYDCHTERQRILASWTHNTSNSNWTTSTKIGFEIRKDRHKIKVYSSDFYDIGNDCNIYDDSKINLTTPVLSVDLDYIKSTTGIDFSNGKVGYGNISQTGAAIVGINLEVFNAYIDTQYIDDIEDTKIPNAPLLRGKCTSESNEEIIYDLDLQCSDKYEKVSYKIAVFETIDWETDDPDSASNKVNAIATSEPISVTTFSDIDTIHLGLNNSEEDLTNNQYLTVSETNITQYEKHYTVKMKKNSLSDKLIFCDNTYSNTFNGINDYLSKYNCQITTFNNKDYLNIIQLLTPSEDPYFHIKDNVTYFSDDFFTQEDISWYYYGEYNFNSLRTFLSNAKCRYKLFKVPGKGEENA